MRGREERGRHRASRLPRRPEKKRKRLRRLAQLHTVAQLLLSNSALFRRLPHPASNRCSSLVLSLSCSGVRAPKEGSSRRGRTLPRLPPQTHTRRGAETKGKEAVSRLARFMSGRLKRITAAPRAAGEVGDSTSGDDKGAGWGGREAEAEAEAEAKAKAEAVKGGKKERKNSNALKRTREENRREGHAVGGGKRGRV